MSVEVWNRVELDAIIHNLERDKEDYDIYDADDELVLDIKCALFPLTIKLRQKAGLLAAIETQIRFNHFAFCVALSLK